MRHLFGGKDYKKSKSLKLQQRLQSEEDRLWAEEQALRQAQELLDEEVARKIQEELEQEQEQQQPSPNESDAALARRFQREFEHNNIRDRHSRPQSPAATSSGNHVLSDEEYARQLQEEFDAEREGRQTQLPVTPGRTNTVSVIPPPLPSKPIAYHNTHYLTSTSAAGSSSHPAVPASSSSASTSSWTGPSTSNTSGRQVPPPPYTPSDSSSSTSCGAAVSVNNIDQPHTIPSRSRTSLGNQGPPLVITIPPLYTSSHSPLTAATPHSTTTTTAAAASSRVTPLASSQSYQQNHIPKHIPGTSSVPPPLPSNAPSAPRVSHAQFPTIPQKSPYSLQENGMRLPQQPEEQQQQQTRYITNNYPTTNGQPPQQQQKHTAQTVGARLFPGHTNSSRVDPVMFMIPPPQRKEKEPVQQQPPQHHRKQSSIPDFMPILVPPAATSNNQATPPSRQESTSTHRNTAVAAFRLEEPHPRHSPKTPSLPIGILKTGHKPDEASPQDTTTRYNHHNDVHTDSDDDDFSADFIFRRQDAPFKEKKSADKQKEPMGSTAETNPFADSYAVESTESWEAEGDEESQYDLWPQDTSRGTPNPATTAPAVTESDEPAHPAFNPVKYLDEDDLVDLDAAATNAFSDDDSSSDDGSVVMVSAKHLPKTKIGVTVAIQTDPIEEINSSTSAMDKKAVTRSTQQQQNSRTTVTRVDPTFGITLPPPVQRTTITPSQSAEDNSLLGLSTPTIDAMQTRLDDLLVDLSIDDVVRDKVDKTQSTEEPPAPGTQVPRSGLMMHQHNHSYSMISLVPPPSTSHLQHREPYYPTPPRLMTPATYHDTLYTTTPMMYHNNASYQAGTLTPGITPEPYHSNEVPTNEYGYYYVESRPTRDKSSKPNTSAQATQKDLPEILKSDPNYRHITVRSTDPNQRVWIRVHPTDTGKDLARRIHVVATYRSRKILLIKTANGRDIPLDDTPVFDDWAEIEKLEDGSPWEVEWGPLDDPFSGGRQLFKHIAANLRAAVMD